MLQVKNVTVNKKGNTILDNVSFTLKKGTHLVLTGPNGAGKSTLIRALALTADFKGDVFYNGVNARTLDPKARARFIGVLMQSNYVNLPYTVYEVAALGRYAYKGECMDETRKKTEQAIKLTELTHLRNRAVTTLSGGELRRVFLAQLLAQDPYILALDEPTNDIDVKYQKQTFDIIQKWVKRENRAAISALHDLSYAITFGTRAILMNKGRICALGGINEVFTPDNLNRAYNMDVCGWLNSLKRN